MVNKFLKLKISFLLKFAKKHLWYIPSYLSQTAFARFKIGTFILLGNVTREFIVEDKNIPCVIFEISFPSLTCAPR